MVAATPLAVEALQFWREVELMLNLSENDILMMEPASMAALGIVKLSW